MQTSTQYFKEFMDNFCGKIVTQEKKPLNKLTKEEVQALKNTGMFYEFYGEKDVEQC